MAQVELGRRPLKPFQRICVVAFPIQTTVTTIWKRIHTLLKRLQDALDGSFSTKAFKGPTLNLHPRSALTTAIGPHGRAKEVYDFTTLEGGEV